MKLVVELPEEMSVYQRELTLFFSMMVAKLYANRHKGFEKSFNSLALCQGIDRELNELREALRHDQFGAFVEAVDVANFAFLLGLGTLNLTRPQFDEERSQ